MKRFGSEIERARLHAQQSVVGLVVLAVGVVRVVGGEQRGADPFGDLDQLRVGFVLGGDPVILQFDEQVVLAEDLLQSSGLVECAFLVAVEQRLQHVPTEAPGGGDQSIGVLLEQLPVDPRLVVVALEERQARELDQIAIAGFVLGQQGEVVVELFAAFGVAARVVDAAASGRPFGAVVVGHVGLGADDRLDALLAAFLVELERAVHVAVIGHADRRLAVGDRLGDQFVEARRPIEHRELGVDVEVAERVGGHWMAVFQVERITNVWFVEPTRTGGGSVQPIRHAATVTGSPVVVIARTRSAPSPDNGSGSGCRWHRQ